MSDLATGNCGCRNCNNCGRSGGFLGGSCIWIIILLLCGCGNGCGNGCNNGCGSGFGLFGNNNNDCFEIIILILLLTSCCNNDCGNNCNCGCWNKSFLSCLYRIGFYE